MKQRRTFLKNAAALGVAASFMPKALLASANEYNNTEGGGYTFLFQGDSITDGNRTRNNDWNHIMGHGYVYLVSSRLWYELPEKKFHFINRGVSGNSVTDLSNRWQQDTLDIKPDLLSILIGINDAVSFIDGNTYNSADNFKARYHALLQQTKDAMPQVQLVMIDPFILPVGKVKDKWDIYSEELLNRQAIVKELAATFNAIHIPMQDHFNNALQRATADYWIWDGIHPMPAGHELMARTWLKEVGKKLKFIK